jgi:hypothetical protein
MSDFTLTEADRKRLTEFLGEKWFDSELKVVHCNTCNCGQFNRTFTTPDDMIALAKALQEKGKWGVFFYFGMQAFEIECADTCKGYDYEYSAWLLHPARFCWLVSEFAKGEKG